MDSIGAYKDLTLVRFGPHDFAELRAFVLRECEDLPEPEFFITDDVDSALPLLLSPDGGLVYGAMHDARLVASQALSYDVEDSVVQRIPRVLRPQGRLIESTWTMVQYAYRRRGVARVLARELESDARSQVGQCSIVATVHPRNVASLRLYFSMGFLGVAGGHHHGVPRITLIKRGGWSTRAADVRGAPHAIDVAAVDIDALADHLASGLVCVGCSVQDGEARLILAPESGAASSNQRDPRTAWS